MFVNGSHPGTTTTRGNNPKPGTQKNADRTADEGEEKEEVTPNGGPI
jgi:hypothetical protein